MNDWIITFITVPFPQGKSGVIRTLCLGFAKMSKDAKDVSWAREEEGWHPQVQATQGRQHLALPTPPGSNKGLASILGSGWWERQTEANCPEAVQFWWEGGEGRRGSWVRGPRASVWCWRNGWLEGIQANYRGILSHSTIWRCLKEDWAYNWEVILNDNFQILRGFDKILN